MVGFFTTEATIKIKHFRSLVAQTLHHLCRATLVALYTVSHFRLMFSAVSHENRAVALKLSQKGPVAPVGGGGVAPQLCTGTGGCRSYNVASRATLRH